MLFFPIRTEEPAGTAVQSACDCASIGSLVWCWQHPRNQATIEAKRTNMQHCLGLFVLFTTRAFYSSYTCFLFCNVLFLPDEAGALQLYIGFAMVYLYIHDLAINGLALAFPILIGPETIQMQMLLWAPGISGPQFKVWQLLCSLKHIQKLLDLKDLPFVFLQLLDLKDIPLYSFNSWMSASCLSPSCSFLLKTTCRPFSTSTAREALRPFAAVARAFWRSALSVSPPTLQRRPGAGIDRSRNPQDDGRFKDPPGSREDPQKSICPMKIHQLLVE